MRILESFIRLSWIPVLQEKQIWPNVVENVEIYCAVLKWICGYFQEPQKIMVLVLMTNLTSNLWFIKKWYLYRLNTTFAFIIIGNICFICGLKGCLGCLGVGRKISLRCWVGNDQEWKKGIQVGEYAGMKIKMLKWAVVSVSLIAFEEKKTAGLFTIQVFPYWPPGGTVNPK